MECQGGLFTYSCLDSYVLHCIPRVVGHIPKLHSTQYSFAGFDLSEKSWIYLLALQLILSDGVPSMVSASAGWLAGYTYEKDGYGMQNWRLPRVIEVYK